MEETLYSYVLLVSFKHIGDYNQALQLNTQLSQELGSPSDILMFDVESDKEFSQDHKVKFLHSVG